MTTAIDEKLNELERFIDQMNERGMRGMAGTVWPVTVQRWPGKLRDLETHYVFKYPRSYFHNLMQEHRLYMPNETKTDRVAIAKLLLDKLMDDVIDIHMYHFGLYMIYHIYGPYKQREDFSESSLGKKRLSFANTLPRAEYESNDDFISSIWSYLIEERYTDIGEYRRNPSFSEVRLLFTAERFGNFSGLYYTDADWVEPIPGARDLECKRWVGEKDPMASQAKKEGMIEGPIILGHEGTGNGLRHFVEGEPIHAGSYIEVKFGDGWITGRYEWNFEKGSPISIHSSRHERFLITEGHQVRVRA